METPVRGSKEKRSSVHVESGRRGTRDIVETAIKMARTGITWDEAARAAQADETNDNEKDK